MRPCPPWPVLALCAVCLGLPATSHAEPPRPFAALERAGVRFSSGPVSSPALLRGAQMILAPTLAFADLRLEARDAIVRTEQDGVLVEMSEVVLARDSDSRGRIEAERLTTSLREWRVDAVPDLPPLPLPSCAGAQPDLRIGGAGMRFSADSDSLPEGLDAETLDVARAALSVTMTPNGKICALALRLDGQRSDAPGAQLSLGTTDMTVSRTDASAELGAMRIDRVGEAGPLISFERARLDLHQPDGFDWKTLHHPRGWISDLLDGTRAGTLDLSVSHLGIDFGRLLPQDGDAPLPELAPLRDGQVALRLAARGTGLVLNGTLELGDLGLLSFRLDLERSPSPPPALIGALLGDRPGLTKILGLAFRSGEIEIRGGKAVALHQALRGSDLSAELDRLETRLAAKIPGPLAPAVLASLRPVRAFIDTGLAGQARARFAPAAPVGAAEILSALLLSPDNLPRILGKLP